MITNWASRVFQTTVSNPLHVCWQGIDACRRAHQHSKNNNKIYTIQVCTVLEWAFHCSSAARCLSRLNFRAEQRQHSAHMKLKKPTNEKPSAMRNNKVRHSCCLLCQCYLWFAVYKGRMFDWAMIGHTCTAAKASHLELPVVTMSRLWSCCRVV